MVARPCHYHAQAIRHICHLLSTELASTLACSLILTRLNYCNSLLHGSHTAVSRHYSTYRTMPPGLFCKHRGSAMQTRCCASSTGCWFVTESTTSWLWWLTRSTAPVYLLTWVSTSTLANQHEHYVHLTLYCSLYHSPGLRSWSMPSNAQLHLSGTHYLHSSPTAALWQPSNLGWKRPFSVYLPTVA